MAPRITVKYVFVCLLVALSGLEALALDWPTARHDQGRTGRAQGHGEITEPAVHWSYNLGGKLGGDQVWIGDADGDGTKEFALVEAGRVFLRNAADQVIWHTGPIGASEIVGAFDLDRDGKDELLATGNGPPASLMILNPLTGETMWFFDAFEEGAINLSAYKVTVADINGDTYLEVVGSPFGHPEVKAFTFASGFSSIPENNLLWSYPTAVYSNMLPTITADFDNDGEMEVAFLERHRLTMLSGKDGQPEAEIDHVLFSHSFGLIQATNVDADEQPEIVALGSSEHNYSITVFDAVEGDVSWQYQWYPTDGKHLAFTENSVTDLDGDGAREIVVSVFGDADDEHTTTDSTPADHDGVNAPDAWTLIVFDGGTGAVERTISNAYLRGVEATAEGERPYLLVQRVPGGNPTVPRFGTVEAYRHTADGLGLVATIANANVSLWSSSSEPARNTSGRSVKVASSDLNGDANSEVFMLRDLDLNNEADILEARAISPDGSVVVASTAMDEWEFVQAVGFGDGFSSHGSHAETALVSSTGFLEILDPSLNLLSSLRIGGFQSSPIAFDLDGQDILEIAVAASNGELRVLDASGASSDTAPLDRWSFQGVAPPILSAADVDGDAAMELAVRDSSDPINPRVLLLGADSHERWATTFSSYGAKVQQIVYGRFDDDDTTDVLVLVQDVTAPDETDLRLVALDGADGQEIWNVPTSQNYRIKADVQPVDITQDGITDLVITDIEQIEYYDGIDGSLIAAVPYSNWNSTSVTADFDLDGAAELLIAANPPESGMLLYDLLAQEPTWNVPHGYAHEVGSRYPALFGQALGLGFVKSTAHGSLQGFGPDGVPSSEPVYLRQGDLLSADPGDVNDIAAATVCDVDGDGSEEVVAGTADGHLMAVNIADWTLVWSLALRSHAYEPVAADVDGDGMLEILIATGDGYLHMVDQKSLDAPGEVRDVALSSDLVPENPDVDIDTTEKRTALGASWDQVEGAVGYHYTVVDEEDIEIVPWASIEGGPPVVIETAPLQLGRSYRVVVQAYGQDDQTSTEVWSDGVEVVDLTPPWISCDEETTGLIDTAADEVEIRATAGDRTWLSRYLVEIMNSRSEVVWTLEEPLFSDQADILAVWDGKDSTGEQVENGTYKARVTVYDLADREAACASSVEVSIEPPDDDDDDDDDDDGHGSCGCSYEYLSCGGLFGWLIKILFG